MEVFSKGTKESFWETKPNMYPCIINLRLKNKTPCAAHLFATAKSCCHFWHQRRGIRRVAQPAKVSMVVAHHHRSEPRIPQPGRKSER